MASPELPDIDFDALALEPVEPGPGQPAGPTPAAPGGVADTRAKFQIDTRSGKDRRVLADRRQEFRITPDRRSGKDRRPRKTWEPGHNL